MVGLNSSLFNMASVKRQTVSQYYRSSVFHVMI